MMVYEIIPMELCSIIPTDLPLSNLVFFFITQVVGGRFQYGIQNQLACQQVVGGWWKVSKWNFQINNLN